MRSCKRPWRRREALVAKTLRLARDLLGMLLAKPRDMGCRARNATCTILPISMCARPASITNACRRSCRKYQPEQRRLWWIRFRIRPLWSRSAKNFCANSSRNSWRRMPEWSNAPEAVCKFGEHHSGEPASAEICQACYERLQERLDVFEAALHLELKEAAQIIYDAVWADPSDPSKTYQNAASALLCELRKRAGMTTVLGPFQPLAH